MKSLFKRTARLAKASVILLAICAMATLARAAEEKEGEEQEVKVTLDQVPAPVKAVFQQEAQGGTIKEIEKEVEDGKTTFEAEIAKGGKTFDLKVAADGKVLEKESDDEERDEGEKAEAAGDAGFAKTFGEEKADLGPTGRNDYFILEPGYVMTLKGNEDGKKAQLVITVRDETRDVDGVKTRVVEELESVGGKVVEISRNYYAISRKTNNVYYFGEESKEYENGKVKSTGGSWEAGKNGARYGLFMPARPKVGEKYYQEIAPRDKAMDRAETVSLTEKVTVPAGSFENCLKVKESSAVEGGTEAKTYAPGVGLLEDGGLKLTQYGMRKK